MGAVGESSAHLAPSLTHWIRQPVFLSNFHGGVHGQVHVNHGDALNVRPLSHSHTLPLAVQCGLHMANLGCRFAPWSGQPVLPQPAALPAGQSQARAPGNSPCSGLEQGQTSIKSLTG